MSEPVSRREFIETAAAVAAASALTGTSSAWKGAHTVRVRKALKIGMIAEGGSLTEKFEIAAKAGFEGVELDSPGPYAVDQVEQAKQATGLQVPGVVDSVHWNKPLSHPDPSVRKEGREALERAIRDCKAFGGTTVLLVPAVVNKEVSYADAYARSQEEIRKVLPLCEQTGIRIAIENVWNNFLLSPLEAARYTDELGPMVGWHFDIGNIVNYGWPEHWIRTLGARIWKLDVKEFSRKRRNDEGLWKGFGVEIGEGDCGWAEVRAALDEIGYRGWAAAEVGGGDLARLSDIARRMDAVLNS
ncbi:MAG: sugar phosphate isomerase/epimerase [Planctomycetota bacterium]|nr:MAG: sugar phosphate isomerase/epimerase [Planctomycetota bacterium]